MTFGQDKNGNPGLIFPSEQEKSASQSILFTIPVTEQFNHSIISLKLDRQTIYFPFLLGDKYFELLANINLPQLFFTVPEVNIQIIFEIDDINFSGWGIFPFKRRFFRRIKYVGSYGKLVPQNRGFLILLPVDLGKMDELYNNYKGVFVGFTPNFGIFPSF